MSGIDKALEAKLRPKREACILSHISLYKFTFARVVRRFYFPQSIYSDPEEGLKRAGDTLSALTRQGKLSSHKFPGKGPKYYTLSGAKRSSGTESIDFDLATLWLCCCLPKRYFRLTNKEMRDLFTSPPHHHVRHVTSNEDGGVIFRIYPTTVSVKDTILSIRRQIREAERKNKLGELIASGDYGFMVLSDSRKKCKEIYELSKQAPPGQEALSSRARIAVEFSPTSKTIGKALEDQARLRALKKKASK